MPLNDPLRPWDPTPVVARWLVQRAEQLHLRLTLVTDRSLEGSLPPALQFVRRSERQTGTLRFQGRAVLAYLPTIATAARALRLAYGGAVAVVEGGELPIAAWAAEVGAHNLLVGRTQPALPPEASIGLQELLQFLDGGRLTPQDAHGVVGVLRANRTHLSAELVTGYLLAHGRSARTIRRVLGLQRVASSDLH